MKRHHVIDKSMDALAESFCSIITDDKIDKAAAMTKTFEQFGDYLKSNLDDDDEQRTNTIEDDEKLSGKLREMVAAMIVAVPSLSEQHAMHFLLHHAAGRKLAEHLNSITKKEPIIMDRNLQLQSIAKDFGITRLCKSLVADNDAHGISEHELTTMGMDEARKQFPNDTPAKAFVKYHDANLEFRKALKIASNQAFGSSLQKSYASLKPTSVEVGSTETPDDSAEAIRLLNEMAEKQHRTFEEVSLDPENRELAAVAFRRPNTSSTSGSELQRR